MGSNVEIEFRAFLIVFFLTSLMSIQMLFLEARIETNLFDELMVSGQLMGEGQSKVPLIVMPLVVGCR